MNVPSTIAEQFPHRWECRSGTAHEYPFLLARFNDAGHTQIKVRDRVYIVTEGVVEATCPLCGQTHRRRIEPVY